MLGLILILIGENDGGEHARLGRHQQNQQRQLAHGGDEREQHPCNEATGSQREDDFTKALEPGNALNTGGILQRGIDLQNGAYPSIFLTTTIKMSRAKVPYKAGIGPMGLANIPRYMAPRAMLGKT